MRDNTKEAVGSGGPVTTGRGTQPRKRASVCTPGKCKTAEVRAEEGWLLCRLQLQLSPMQRGAKAFSNFVLFVAAKTGSAAHTGCKGQWSQGCPEPLPPPPECWDIRQACSHYIWLAFLGGRVLLLKTEFQSTLTLNSGLSLLSWGTSGMWHHNQLMRSSKLGE